mmetsp:Transcript_5190/g.8730  ORF Transcript_5190/g.8730 Transcript_5190/m.8730 type:complete len:120 (-) Transcript_5190:15-374(-)
MAQYVEPQTVKKRYTFKIEVPINTVNDVLIATNDSATANALCEWYTKATGCKTKPQKSHQFVKEVHILDNAKKDKALGVHWNLVLCDKLLEFGYKPAFASTVDIRNSTAAVPSYLFVSE